MCKQWKNSRKIAKANLDFRAFYFVLKYAKRKSRKLSYFVTNVLKENQFGTDKGIKIP